MVRLKEIGLLLASCGLPVYGAPKTSPASAVAMVTPAPDPGFVLKAVDCVKSSTFSTDKASLVCSILPNGKRGILTIPPKEIWDEVGSVGHDKRQHIVPHTCGWVGGVVTVCVKGPRTLPENVSPYNPQPITMIDATMVQSTTSIVATTTGTARIGLAPPAAAGAAWLFTLSEDLMSEIYDISAEVCAAAKHRRMVKRQFGGVGGPAMPLACHFGSFDAQRKVTFQDRLADLLENEEVGISNMERFEEQLASAARADPSAMLEDVPEDLTLAELEAEEAVVAMPVLSQQAAMTYLVHMGIADAILASSAGTAIYMAWEVTNDAVVKALAKVKAETSTPLPQTSVEPTTTSSESSSSTLDQCAMCTASDACKLDPNEDQGQDGQHPLMPPIITGAPTSGDEPICHHHQGESGKEHWCNCPDGNRYSTTPYTYLYTYTSPKTSTATVTELCPYTEVPDPSLSYNQPSPSITPPPAVIAPKTEGYVSPTTAVPTGTAFCHAAGGDDTFAEWTIWKQPFLQAAANEFCTYLYDHPEVANPQNPFWVYKQFPALWNSNPVFNDVGFYIHYEKQACDASNQNQEVKLGGEGGLDCYAHYQWLWTTGCNAVLKNNYGDVGNDRYGPQMGYYSNCMWWGITTAEDPSKETRTPCTTVTAVTFPYVPDATVTILSATSEHSGSWPITCAPTPATTTETCWGPFCLFAFPTAVG
ncbi:hypothetical protein AC578_3026 [Pseudocercospora eumusae]|uniref:Uncharacterized protein n=1 Tax=Pseudocercospora eumusae TaxID=321146 RepID=A0A139HA20_9PEZI|nr:hypothetical protein AC578_3026 [Pseudocercospora eumusae]